MGQVLDRRQFVKAGLAASLAASLNRSADAESPTRPPNILYIFSDQHRSQSVNPFDSEIYTPNINAMRTNGFVMQNTYTNFPLCSPYRAILQTGTWPQVNGMVANDIVNATTEQTNNVADLNPSFNTGIAQILKAGANYYCGYIGKWDLFTDTGSYLQPGNAHRFGYDEWMVWFNNDSHWTGGGPNPPAGTAVNKTNSSYTYATLSPNVGTKAFVFPYVASPATGIWNPHCQTLQAVDFLQRNQTAEEPWILFVSYNVPHPPYDPPDGAAPGKPSNGYHYYNESATPTLRANVNIATTNGVPGPGLNQIHSSSDPASYSNPNQTGKPFLATVPLMDSTTWDYYEGVSDVDTEIQLLLAQVNDDPNTIVIYTSDHGDMLGSHTLSAKQFPHEESSSVPFYVVGNVNGVPITGSYSGLFSAIDIAPTLCGLASVTPPSNMSGQNFASVITGQAADLPNPNQYVFLMNGPGDPMNGGADSTFDGYYACPVYRGLRTARYTYASVATYNYNWFENTAPATSHTNVGPYEGGHWCLFDNQLDPYQTNNLIVNGQYPASTESQPVPDFGAMQTALAGFIAQNGGGSNGNDPFTSPICSLVLTPGSTQTIKLGVPVTITATMQQLSTGAAVPTGKITYSVDGGSPTVVNLVKGVASFILTGLSELQHIVTAVYSGDSIYQSVPTTLSLNGNVAQSILFPPLPNVQIASIQTIALSARTTSNELVTYTVTGPATLNPSSATLSLAGTGTVTVTASAASNSSFAAATSITRSFIVS